MSLADKQLLLAAIQRYPGDDTVRLAYADLLEECGEAGRAEFIRVQMVLEDRLGECGCCRHLRRGLPGLPPSPCRCTAAYRDLREREKSLIADNWETWHKEVPGSVVSGNNTVFRRGFAYECQYFPHHWHQFGPLVVRDTPVERALLAKASPEKVDGVYVWDLSSDVTRHPWSIPSPFSHPELWENPGTFARKHYATVDEAMGALSNALMTWARKMCNALYQNS